MQVPASTCKSETVRVEFVNKMAWNIVGHFIPRMLALKNASSLYEHPRSPTFGRAVLHRNELKPHSRVFNAKMVTDMEILFTN